MSKFIISIDLGGTNTRVAIVDSRLKIKSKLSFPTKSYISHRTFLIDEIVKVIKLSLNNNRLNKLQVLGLGIGVPGPVDFKNGLIHYLPNIPHWQNTPLRKILRNRLGFDVFVDNDVNLMALAEARLGAAKGANNAVCITLGTGVGGGLILDGEIYRGTDFCAGEIGHMPINVDGPKCNCGGKACLERYIGNKYVLMDAQNKFKNKNITLEELSKLARDGNIKALEIFATFSNRLGVALTGVVNLVNPEVIVIGGGLSYSGGFLFRDVQKVIRERAMPTHAKRVQVKRALLGSNAGLIGAALLVKENKK